MKTGEKMPKIACFTSKNCLFYVARLTILGCKVDCLGLQDTRNGCEGGLKRCLEMLISTFSVVKIFHTTECFFAGQQRRTSGCLKTSQAKNCRCGYSGNKKKVVMTHHGDGHDDLFLLCRYCEKGCALTFMTPC